MLFTKENCEKVLAGTKTMTRRVCHPNDCYEPQRIGGPAVIDTASIRDRWVVGKDYAICPGRGKKAIGRIRITAIRRERLHDISEADCIREGFPGYYEFSLIWYSLYGLNSVKGWDVNPDVWVISFELVTDAH